MKNRPVNRDGFCFIQTIFLALAHMRCRILIIYEVFADCKSTAILQLASYPPFEFRDDIFIVSICQNTMDSSAKLRLLSDSLPQPKHKGSWDNKLTLPAAVWQKLTYAWVVFLR